MPPYTGTLNIKWINWLQAGGVAELERLLAQEKADALPEYLKQRPKYYYYYNWMRERVVQSCGELPGPVMEKLIRIDATELDMLLTYPTGIKQQASIHLPWESQMCHLCLV